MTDQLYMMWLDVSKQPTSDKIAQGAATYTARFHRAPTVLLCNARDVTVVAGLRVEARTHILPGNFWFAYEAPRYPGADWASHQRAADGKSAPALITVDGRTLEYVPGSLLAGQAEYREMER